MQLGKYGAGIECGQRVYWRRSWRRTKSMNRLRFRKWNYKFGRGFAFGPIMFWKRF